jgi:hypothetical protein
MADETVVHIGENSPEQIAHRLLMAVAFAEGKKIFQGPSSPTDPANRKWILDTFAECMNAVRHPDYRVPLA